MEIKSIQRHSKFIISSIGREIQKPARFAGLSEKGRLHHSCHISCVKPVTFVLRPVTNETGSNLLAASAYSVLTPVNLDNLLSTIKACINRDPKQQKALYQHYFGYCLKIVFRYVYRYETAVDIVNDGFVKAFKNLDKLVLSDAQNQEPMLMGWLRTIMIHTAIDHLRKNNFLPEIGSLSESIWAMEDKSQRSDKTLLYKELIQQVRKLPPSYRTVFNMYVIDGFSHQEIADRLGISVGTSKSNLSKARTILQQCIKENDQELNYAATK